MRLRGPCQNKPNQAQFRTNRLGTHRMHRQMGKKRKIPCLLQSLPYNSRLFRQFVVGEFLEDKLEEPGNLVL